MSKGTLLIILLIVASIGSMILRIVLPADMLSGKESALAAPAATRAPTNTVRPTVIPSPTIDLVATANTDAVIARNEAVVSNENALKERAAAAAARETADGLQITALQLTEQIGQHQVDKAALELKAAEIHATERAKELTPQAEQISATRTQSSVQATQTLEAPTQIVRMAQAQADAQYAGIRAVTEPIASLLWPLVGIGFVIVAGFAIRGRQPPEIVEVVSDAGPGVTWIKKGNRAERIDAAPCTREQWEAWAPAMLNGHSGSINAWEYAGSPFTGGEYRKPGGLHEWAIQNEIIAITDGVQKLTNFGREYCLTRTTSPSPIDDLP